MERVSPLKSVEIRIVAELMKNSRRSDRELAKAVGVSQPTVSRVIQKLEKEGVIREYTMIPDFTRLGFNVMGVSEFQLNEEAYERRTEIRNRMINDYGGLIAVEGRNSNKNRLTVHFYKDYSEYAQAVSVMRTVPIIEFDKLETFLVDLNKPGYRVLSMSAIANLLLKNLEDRNVKE